MQIRTKLTLQFILLVAGILLLSLCFIYYKFSDMVEGDFYNSLRSKALMTAEMVLHDETTLKPISAATPDLENGLPFKDNIVIYNENFQKVFAFNPAHDPLEADRLRDLLYEQEYRSRCGETFVMGVTHQARSGAKYIIVAESKFDPTELVSLRNILIVTFLLGVGIVALGGWLYAGRAMDPVARIINQVDRILPSDLSARLEATNNRDEISRLIVTFNRLLDRIQFAFRMQKSFISNVSHELKNPLSVVISQLEIAMDRERSPEEYRETLQSVLEDTRELNNIADKLLQLARLHSEGNQINFEQVRLDETMLQTRSALLRMHPEYQISFDLIGAPETEEELCVQANEPLLRAALLNLMENGCKFSPDHRVDVKIYFDEGGHHKVEIRDHGPGIPAKDLQQIFQPFYRGAQNVKVRGSGIGLSLVDSILKVHRVALDVRSKEGEGTVFSLSFPSAA
ncbi:MAG: HAMP domain-containing protein [Chitinophagales bacterium]|nr:HAMP domain-containing protein [Chitinophagales bacterium]